MPRLLVRRRAARAARIPHRYRPACGGGQAKVLTAAEITRVDKCLTGTRNEHRNRALFFLQLATGIRVGELAALNVGDVLENGALRRRFHLPRVRRSRGQPRVVYFENERARAVLQSYLRNRRPNLDFGPEDPLFTGQKPDHDGNFRLTANTLAHLFCKLYRNAGIVGASSDSGRRWFLGQLARAGIRDEIIRNLAGHAHVSTTRRYLDRVSADQQCAVRAVEF